MRRNLISAALIATSAGLLVAAVPAIAQNREADIRFEAAQRRFDGELAMFKAEVARYEQARMAAPQVSAAPPRNDVPRVISDDAARNLDEPGASVPAPPPRDTVDREEAGNQPPR